MKKLNTKFNELRNKRNAMRKALAKGKAYGKDGNGGGKGSNVSLAERSTGCKMPTDLDPEGWDCECHASMKQKCLEVYNASEVFNENDDMYCFQALLCTQQSLLQFRSL